MIIRMIRVRPSARAGSVRPGSDRCVALPQPGQARVWIGFGFPLVVGPPACITRRRHTTIRRRPITRRRYYAPPPPAYSQPAIARRIFATVEPVLRDRPDSVCPMEHPVAPGPPATAPRRRAACGVAPPDGAPARRGSARSRPRGRQARSPRHAATRRRAIRGADRGLCADRRLPQRGAGQPRRLDRLAVLAALRQSRACFAALVGTPDNGRWRIAPAEHTGPHPPAVPARHADPGDRSSTRRTAASR